MPVIYVIGRVCNKLARFHFNLASADFERKCMKTILLHAMYQRSMIEVQFVLVKNEINNHV